MSGRRAKLRRRTIDLLESRLGSPETKAKDLPRLGALLDRAKAARRYDEVSRIWREMQR